MSYLTRFALLLLLGLFGTTGVADQSATGVWQTESSDKGYLHVLIEPCENKLCGKILMAYDLENTANDTYEHIGKNMVWDMNSSADAKWSGGKIWDPSADKTYKSKMSLKDGERL